MSKFISDLILRDNGDGRTFTLDAELVYESDLLDGAVVVPAGTITDLASIPLLSHHRTWTRAAVIHDGMYLDNGVTRKQADDVLREAMGILRVPCWRRWLVYASVRLFGGTIWAR